MHLFKKRQKEDLKRKISEFDYQNHMNDNSNLIEVKLQNKRVLVIGDLHTPFTKDGYLDHCKMIYKKWKCDTVVFIGDVIDNHYASYHEIHSQSLSGEDELQFAIDQLAKWYKVFPNAYVTIGNHDRLISRKCQTSSIPLQWIKTYKSVLNTPNWSFVEELQIDDVVYVHGEGGNARTKAKNDLQSVVQGHLHSLAYIEFFVGNDRKIFAMQVGCGVDRKSYAMAYAKHFKKQIMSCGTVINGYPYLEIMQL